jgi:DNA transformation protein
MTRPDAFAEYVVELLAPLGRVHVRRMFGGHGVYCDDIMFALIADEVLYFKVDAATRARFEQAGSEQFTYETRGKRAAMSYWRAPDEAMDAPHAALPWARDAYAAALRSRAASATARRLTRRK